VARKKKSYQQGSIRVYRAKSGTVYRLRYRERKPDGGWAEVTETLRDCTSKKAARKILDERLQKINGSNGGMVQGAPKTMSDLLGSVWPNYLSKQRVKRSTRDSWGSIVKKWIVPYFGNRILDEIEPQDIGDFINHLDSQGLSSKYQINAYVVLKLMFDVAQLNGFMRSNPVHPKIHRPAVERKRKHVWSVEQGRSILFAVEYIFRAPLMVLALTGLRAGELLALRWRNIDFLRRRITIDGSVYRGELDTTKTESSDRSVGMSEELAQILAEHRGTTQSTGPDDFVFCKADGTPISPDSLRRRGIYPALKAAGVPYVARASGCHAFRHLAGSVINKGSGNLKLAQTQLGHADVSTTGNIYVHVDDEQIDRAAEILSETLGGICGKSVAKPPLEKGIVQ